MVDFDFEILTRIPVLVSVLLAHQAPVEVDIRALLHFDVTPVHTVEPCAVYVLSEFCLNEYGESHEAVIVDDLFLYATNAADQFYFAKMFHNVSILRFL